MIIMAAILDIVLNLGSSLFSAEEDTFLAKVATIVKYCIFLSIPFIGWAIVEIFFCIVNNPIIFAGLWFLLTILGVIAEYFNNAGLGLRRPPPPRPRIQSQSQTQPSISQSQMSLVPRPSSFSNQQQHQDRNQRQQEQSQRSGLPPIIDMFCKTTDPTTNDTFRNLCIIQQQVQEMTLTIPDVGTQTDAISTSTEKIRNDLKQLRERKQRGQSSGSKKVELGTQSQGQGQWQRQPFDPDVGTQTHKYQTNLGLDLDLTKGHGHGHGQGHSGEEQKQQRQRISTRDGDLENFYDAHSDSKDFQIDKISKDSENENLKNKNCEDNGLGICISAYSASGASTIINHHFRPTTPSPSKRQGDGSLNTGTVTSAYKEKSRDQHPSQGQSQKVNFGKFGAEKERSGLALGVGDTNDFVMVADTTRENETSSQLLFLHELDHELDLESDFDYN